MEDLISEYGQTIIVLIIGAGIVTGFVELLTSIWSGGMFV